MKKLSQKNVLKKAVFTSIILLAIVFAVSCNRSDDLKKSTPHSHAFGEWKTVNAPTCSENGSEERICKCGEKEERELAKTGHSLGDWYRSTTEADKFTVGVNERRDCINPGCSHCEIKSISPASSSANATKVYTISNDAYPYCNGSALNRTQGGCIYGDYIFQSFIDATESHAVIVRKNIKTGEVAYTKVVDVLEHANDMTYNPKNKTLYVAPAYKTYSKKVYAFSEDCFAPAGQTPKSGCKVVNITSYASGLDYVEEKDIYIVYTGGTMYFYNSDWKEIIPNGKETSAVKIDVMGQITQGICADENYIYMIYCSKLPTSSKYSTYIYIYDHNVNNIKAVTVSIPGNYEPENISIVDGTLYIGACSRPFGFYEIKAN